MLEIFYYNGTVHKAEVKDLPKLKRKKVWIDCTNITKEESKILKDAFNLHPLTREDLLNLPTRIKVEEFPNYLFCVFYGVRKSRTVESLEFDFVLGKHFFISKHKREVRFITELKNNHEKLGKQFKKGLDFMLHKMLDTEIDNYFPVLELLDSQIEALQEDVPLRPDHRFVTRIMRLKRSIVNVKRLTYQQREKVSFLAKNDYAFISEKAVPYFRDIYDHAIKIVDLIDNARESISNTYEIYMSSVSNHMNQVMKVLGIIATITLPITALSGIYGTNFHVLPGADWPHGFWAMIGIMVVMSIGLILFFRRKGWF